MLGPTIFLAWTGQGFRKPRFPKSTESCRLFSRVVHHQRASGRTIGYASEVFAFPQEPHVATEVYPRRQTDSGVELYARLLAKPNDHLPDRRLYQSDASVTYPPLPAT